MSRRAKILTAIACVVGAASVAWPIVARLNKPQDQRVAERATKAYIQKARHRSVSDVACLHDSHLTNDDRLWLCAFVYGSSVVPHRPHSICIRVIRHVGRRLKCNVEL